LPISIGWTFGSCRAGIFHRDVSDGEHAEIALGEHIYRVQLSEIG
jgi:hypothetical protein